MCSRVHQHRVSWSKQHASPTSLHTIVASCPSSTTASSLSCSPSRAACAVVTTPFAMFAAMAFDAPGSEHQLGAWVVFFVVLSIPLWFVLGAITGWFLYLRNWLRASALIAATPIAATTMGWLPCNWHNRCDGHVVPHPGRRPPPPHHLSDTASLTSDRLRHSQSPVHALISRVLVGLSTSAWGCGGLRGQRRLPTIPRVMLRAGFSSAAVVMRRRDGSMRPVIEVARARGQS